MPPLENNWAFDYLPKLDIPNYDILKVFDLMGQGKVNGYMCQGFNPIAALPDKNRVDGGAGQAQMAGGDGPAGHRNLGVLAKASGPITTWTAPTIQTEVIRLPTTCFAEEDGSLVNSSRWLQWHWKGADGPGEAYTDIRIMSELFLRLRQRYQAEGGAYPDPLLKLSWPYKVPDEPSPEELAKEINGYAVTDFTDATGRAYQGQRATGRFWPAQGRRWYGVRVLDFLWQLDRNG